MNTPSSADYIRRECGILLHPTSLPGRHGIGEPGAEAREFVDFLQASGQRLWQVLPLSPTGHGGSPYMARSAMAGNPLLISIDEVINTGLLGREEIGEGHRFPDDHVDYEAVEACKLPLLRRAYRSFRGSASSEQRGELDRFCEQNATWLDDYALYMALGEARGRTIWLDWESPLAEREPEAIAQARRAMADEIDFRRFTQFLFFAQWEALRYYAHERSIRIVGDVPIFVALDSADVWTSPDLFHLDKQGRPTIVAGVPPDYFCQTGQLWGNPLYRWDVLAQREYDWWIKRFQATLKQVDLIRIDHFRGFEAYWAVPASHHTAERGTWRKGPGEAFFRAVEGVLGRLPVIAEDLGLITPEVTKLRLRLGYPGMRVLQFAFDGGADNPHLPENYEQRSVIYTGTHDNDTTLGWFKSLPARTRANVLKYVKTKGTEINWDLMEVALRSLADVAVVPLQDVLGLGAEARMNTPGQGEGNWRWRFRAGQLQPGQAERLRALAVDTGRLL